VPLDSVADELADVEVVVPDPLEPLLDVVAGQAWTGVGATGIV
jgi:hypothetical protein